MRRLCRRLDNPGSLMGTGNTTVERRGQVWGFLGYGLNGEGEGFEDVNDVMCMVSTSVRLSVSKVFNNCLWCDRNETIRCHGHVTEVFIALFLSVIQGLFFHVLPIKPRCPFMYFLPLCHNYDSFIPRMLQ